MKGETRNPILVLLADKQTAVREALRWSFNDLPGFKVVGEAATGREAIDKTAVLTPDLIILDNDLPDAEGLQLVPCLKDLVPQVSIIFLALPQDHTLKQKALAAGGHAFVEKDAGWDALLATIDQLNLFHQPGAS